MAETQRRLEMSDYVHELTERHHHRENYQVREAGQWQARHWSTKVPSLLEQLWTNDTPSQSAEDGPRPGFASKPAARLDALDAAVRIDLEASRWVRDLGEDDPSDTAACVRLLNGLAASADHVTRKAIEHDVRRWWIRARIVTGWDSPAWTPDNTCPQCGERGTLKIRLADRVGMCSNDACRVVWDETSIGVLADHIRAESTAERVPRESSGPCWCPWPEPDVPDLGRLCPRCGSARCWHAVRARLLDRMRGTVGGRIGA
jgi:hypothetical protein